MTDSHEQFEENLRRARLGRPAPDLRERTMRAVRAQLATKSAPAAWRTFPARWRVEMALAAGIIACLCVLPWLDRWDPDRTSTEWHRQAARAEQVVKALGINGSLEPYLKLRLAAALSTRGESERTEYDERYGQFENWKL